MKRYSTNVEIEAIQYKAADKENTQRIYDFLDKSDFFFYKSENENSLSLGIDTVIELTPGDYLIKVPNSDSYFSMSEDDFNKYYKPVESKRKNLIKK